MMIHPKKIQKKEYKNFKQEFHTLHHILKKSDNFLLVAHPLPDSDTLGSSIALFLHLKENKKRVTLACEDSFPKEFSSLLGDVEITPLSSLTISDFDVIIACDSVERSYQQKILPLLNTESQITTIIDHHPGINTKADIRIVDPNRSSTCEILSEFFFSQNLPITSTMANALLVGIVGDTGNFQHNNTSKQTLCWASRLIAKGASLKDALSTINHKHLTTLKLWGIAFEKAKICPETGMAVTAITQEDIGQCKARGENVSQIANMLATIPGVTFSLILTQYKDSLIKGSFRSEPHNNIDVSSLAQKLGGGGHKLASAFTLKGRLIEEGSGWKIV